MSTTYHPEGNRDFRRWLESGIPNTGIMLGGLGYASQMGRIGGQNKSLATALPSSSY